MPGEKNTYKIFHKKGIFTFALLFISLLWFTSCMTFPDIQKRRYSSGYHISFYSHSKKKKEAAPKTISYAPPVLTHNSLSETVPLTIAKPENKNTFASTGKVSLVNKPQRSTAQLLKEQTVTKNNLMIRSSIDQKKSAAPSLSKHKKDKIFIALSCLTGLISLLSFKKLFPRIKKISVWAKDNPNKAKAGIVSSQLALISSALLTGNYLHHEGINTGIQSTHFLLAAVTGTIFLFPMQNKLKGLFRFTHLKQKLFTLLLSVLSFFLCVNVGNRNAQGEATSASQVTKFQLLAPVMQVLKVKTFLNSTKEFSTDTSTEKKQMPNDGTVALRIFLCLLIGAAFLFLCVCIAALSCSISCSGNDTLAAFVLIFGLAACIALSVLTFKALAERWHRKDAEKLNTPPPIKQ